jgi:hypothetical protein
MSLDVMIKTTRPRNVNSTALDRFHSRISSPTKLLSFNKSTGWIVAQGTVRDHAQNHMRLCWLPVELRGGSFDAHETMFVIASESNHQLTIIDFETMLTMLHQLGVFSLPQSRTISSSSSISSVY